MNASDIKILLFREIDNLPESSLVELQRVVHSFVANAEKMEEPKKKRVFGSLKGTVSYMSPDFNAPMEEFNDYK